MTLLSLFGSIRLQLPVRQPIPTWPGSETAIHTLEEKYGPLSRTAATWKKPRKPLSCSRFLLSLTDETPTPSLSFPLCRSQSVTRHLCWRELLFFHLKVYAKKGKKASTTWPVPLIYSRLCSFPLFSLLVCFLLPSASAISYPSTAALPTFSASSFFLIPPPVCLSLVLMGVCNVCVCVCVCAGWTAGGAELVGEAENGLRSQNPGSSLMGGLAWLPAASVHQLRPII